MSEEKGNEDVVLKLLKLIWDDKPDLVPDEIMELDITEKARYRWMPEYLTTKNKDLIKQMILENFKPEIKKIDE